MRSRRLSRGPRLRRPFRDKAGIHGPGVDGPWIPFNRVSVNGAACRLELDPAGHDAQRQPDEAAVNHPSPASPPCPRPELSSLSPRSPRATTGASRAAPLRRSARQRPAPPSSPRDGSPRERAVYDASSVGAGHVLRRTPLSRASPQGGEAAFPPLPAWAGHRPAGHRGSSSSSSSSGSSSRGSVRGEARGGGQPGQGYCAPLAAGTGTGSGSSTISTRRFIARPSTVPFVATGRDSP